MDDTLTAKKTEDARNKGGSPTALLEYTALGFGVPRNNDTLNTPKITKKNHYLYTYYSMYINGSSSKTCFLCKILFFICKKNYAYCSCMDLISYLTIRQLNI